MRKLPNFGTDELLTRYEMEYVQKGVVSVLGEMLVGRQIFADGHLGRGWDGGPGKKYYTYYTEVDQGEALISMEGITQKREGSMRDDHMIRVPAITQDFELQWRDLESARSEGFDLLGFHANAAARKIAESEDELLISGEHGTWGAYGVEGLATATGRNTLAGGAWSANALDNILAAWALLQEDGFYDKPVLIAGPTLIKCLMDARTDYTDLSVLRYLIENDILSGYLETSNLFTGDTQDTTALLVDPDPDYLYYVEGQAPTFTTWMDKHENVFGLIRETIAPVIARPECIVEITGLSCA